MLLSSGGHRLLHLDRTVAHLPWGARRASFVGNVIHLLLPSPAGQHHHPHDIYCIVRLRSEYPAHHPHPASSRLEPGNPTPVRLRALCARYLGPAAPLETHVQRAMSCAFHDSKARSMVIASHSPRRRPPLRLLEPPTFPRPTAGEDPGADACARVAAGDGDGMACRISGARTSRS
ncbi:hypothetical protein B0H13DRAFT_1202022 [Mycena leptocephala]|nr:hypothetical protein B0H13DRAFT_1202022 [Mycena leptocephala]